jgi:hypothetical protein
VSCKKISKIQFDKIKPVNPPRVNIKIKPIIHKNKELNLKI